MWPNQVLLQARTHTHLCVCARCGTIKLKASPKDQRIHKGLADHLLVLQNLSMQSCTEGQGLRQLGRPNSAGSIRMCVAEQTNSALHPRVKGYNKRFGRPVVAVSTQMCVAEYVISRLHPRVKGLQGFGALLRGHIVKARASCRIDQSRIAPTGQGLQLLLWAHTCVLQRGGRPIAAVSIHMCVCVAE